MIPSPRYVHSEMMQFGILPKYEAQIVKESIQMDFTLILIDLEKK